MVLPAAGGPGMSTQHVVAACEVEAAVVAGNGLGGPRGHWRTDRHPAGTVRCVAHDLLHSV